MISLFQITIDINRLVSQNRICMHLKKPLV